MANRLIDAYLYGEQHPYGKYIKAADYDALTSDQLKQHFQQYYVNGNCVIFVAGKLPSDLFEQLNKNFGTLNLTSNIIPSEAGQISNSIIASAEKKYRIQNDVKGGAGRHQTGNAFPKPPSSRLYKNDGAEHRVWWFLWIKTDEQYPGRKRLHLWYTQLCTKSFSEQRIGHQYGGWKRCM